MLYHPQGVHFPIALWLTSLLFDVLYLVRRNGFFANASLYLIGLGLVGAAVSIATGWVDLLAQIAQGVGTGVVIQHRLHSVLGYAATAIYLASFLGRWRRPPLPRWALFLGFAGALILVVGSYLGGELRRVM